MKSFLARQLCISKRGSILGVTIMMCLLLAIYAEAMMSMTLNSSKMNLEAALNQEARLAAEGAGEYIAGRVAAEFDRRIYIPDTELRNSNTATLLLPPNYANNWAGTHVDSSSIQVQAGEIDKAKVYFLDPADPASLGDPFSGRSYTGRNIDIYASATATDPGLKRAITARVFQRLQVRDAPIFTNAIFYNMDMELSASERFDVTGPVTVNGNVYFDTGVKTFATNDSATTSKKEDQVVTFKDTVSISGKLINGSLKSPTQETLNTRDNLGMIYIDGKPLLKPTRADGSTLDYSNVTASELKDYTNWYDSRNTGDGALLDNAFSKKLKTGENGGNKNNVSGFKDYVADDPSTSASELQNNPYALIEPAMPKTGAGSGNYKGELESQKMAYKASLIFKLEKNPAFDDTHDPSDSNSFFKIKAYKTERTKADDPLSAPVLDSTGKPKLIPVTIPDDLIGKANSTLNAVANPSTGLSAPEVYKEQSDSVVGGMYDPRQQVALNMTSLDVGKLKTLIHANDPALFGDTFDPAKDWNGVVYFETPTSTTVNSDGSYAYQDSTRADKISPSAMANQAIQLVNASAVPNPAFAVNKGFAFATNAPLYTVGNVNADGQFTTGDNSEITPENNEASMAIYADSVTALSNNWASNRAKSRKQTTSPIAGGRLAEHTEISAAIVTGITPTSDTSHISGGANNVVRFLENWGGKNFVLRTSIVGMFKSEVQPNSIDTAQARKWFSNPTRRIGFNSKFKNGEFAPGTPNVRQVRRVAYRDLNESQFQTGLISVAAESRPTFK